VNPAILNIPFVQVALPIVLTIFIAAWLNSKGMGSVNRRIDDLRTDMNKAVDSLRGDMNRRFDAVEVRLDRIERKQDDHDTRITRVEERTTPLGRR